MRRYFVELVEVDQLFPELIIATRGRLNALTRDPVAASTPITAALTGMPRRASTSPR